MYDSRSATANEKTVYRHKIRQVVASSQGFTLIEIILVIILLSVITVTALPKFFDTTGIAIEGAAAMVTADIRYTQELAMSTHQDKTIIFPDVPPDGATYYTVDSKTVNLPSKVRIPNGSGATFTFNSLGEPIAGGGSSVQIQAGSSTKTITVDSYTGRVSSS